MKNSPLLDGALAFRKSKREEFQNKFRDLAKGQSPHTLFITCSDSRIVPTTVTTSDPGDLFMVRNVGNMVPCCSELKGQSSGDSSEVAAIEFALASLKVSQIVVCGHSSCGAMKALLGARETLPFANLKEWLSNGDRSLESFKTGEISIDSKWPEEDQLSQVNVLKQVENIKSYPLVSEGLASEQLSVQAWWYDIATADVYAYSEEDKRFSIIE